MTTFRFLCISIVLACSDYAAPKDTGASNDKLRRDVLELFRHGQGDQAVALYQSSLATSAHGKDRSIEVANGLLTIAAQLFNERKIAAARDAGTRVISEARGVLAQGRPGPEMASLLTNIGFLYEELYFDPDTAVEMYQSAADADPGYEAARLRKQAAERKIKQRKAVLGK